MAQGEILWFDRARGFGFIRPDMGPKDVFVHVSALAEAGIDALPTGARVEFEMVQTGAGRVVAHRVLQVEARTPPRPASGRKPA